MCCGRFTPGFPDLLDSGWLGMAVPVSGQHMEGVSVGVWLHCVCGVTHKLPAPPFHSTLPHFPGLEMFLMPDTWWA